MTAPAVEDGEPAPPAVTFGDGLPGFPAARRFSLERWGGDDSPFSVLQSLDDEALRFVVVPPDTFFPDYAPVLDDGDADRLGLAEPEDAIVLVVVSLGERVEDATANLLGPVVVNRHTLAAAQVVLSGQDLPARRRLVNA
ncbi:MAG: flagellar assembly protein FliW [Acidimicrobiales bacterium]